MCRFSRLVTYVIGLNLYSFKCLALGWCFDVSVHLLEYLLVCCLHFLCSVLPGKNNILNYRLTAWSLCWFFICVTVVWNILTWVSTSLQFFLLHCYCDCSHNVDIFLNIKSTLCVIPLKGSLKTVQPCGLRFGCCWMYFTVYLKFSKHLFYTCLGKGLFVMVEECNILINSDINIVGKCFIFQTINNLVSLS